MSIDVLRVPRPRFFHDAGRGPARPATVERPREDDGGHQRIRCPRCRWQPRAGSRWWCDCGTSWNTFDTRGLCPGCGYQWHRTACLSCSAWSPHEAWYEAAPE